MNHTRTTTTLAEAAWIVILCFGWFILASSQSVAAGFQSGDFSDSAMLPTLAMEVLCASIAGGEGDVWRFDGRCWHMCPMPTNLLMESICCAGDGFVYIGLLGGGIVKGRENSWQVIHEAQMTLPFKDLVWYAGKVWATSDHGLWVIENDRVVEAEVPAEIKACSGNLSVGDGVMLLAGGYGAAVFDGKNWEVIISSFAYADERRREAG